MLGFLFGIPQYLAGTPVGGDAPKKASYQPNTNLTQVSDWLTKIIIGVGLVQFSQLAKTIGKLGDSLSSSLGGSPTGKPYGIALVVGYFVIGFLVSYLYTRLRLQWAFAQADRGAFEEIIEDRDNADKKLLRLSTQQLDPNRGEPPRQELAEAFQNASAVARDQVVSKALEAKALADPAGVAERAQVILDISQGEKPPDGS